MNSKEIMDLLEWTGAIMKGHFKLTSGMHSDTYIEKFRLLENPIALDKICLTMAEQYREKNIDLVIGAAIGGILLSGGVGRHLNCKHIFSERLDGKMVFKRGFNIDENKNILIVEDIVSTGGSIHELIDLINKYNANIIGITSIVNRSNKNLEFDSNFTSLLSLPVESWNESEIPSWLKKIPLIKPGSTGK
jgi:orotate phosphoribosyltransferase